MNLSLQPQKLFVLLSIAVLCSASLNCTSAKLETHTTAENIALAGNAVNINIATAQELEEIPSIGPVLAERIIQFRIKNGKYRRPEHLLLVPGIGEKRFSQIRKYIRIE